MDSDVFKSDCANCAALCCVALAFDKSNMFAIDKAAGNPCPNLGPNHKCNIHKDLKTKGFQGCINYDCSGAGQLVTQQVFVGKSWRDHPALLVEMLAAFHGMRHLQDQSVVLQAAKNLQLSTEQQQQVQRFESQLARGGDWSVDQLETFQSSPLFVEIRSFLKSLAPLVAGGRDQGAEHGTESKA